MWQILLPEVALVKVRLLVVIDIILVLFESAEVDDFVGVAKATHTFARSKDGVDEVHKVVVEVAVNRHSPALIACHTAARGNDGVGKERVEHGDKENAEVSYPRNYAFGMQRSPTAAARKNMHTGSAVPSHK